jgi:carboxymethylenebutenolidase
MRRQRRLSDGAQAPTVEVYQANHGWCVKGGTVYDAAEAERAWTALSQLCKA